MYVVTTPPSFKKIHGRKRGKIYCQFCPFRLCWRPKNRRTLMFSFRACAGYLSFRHQRACNGKTIGSSLPVGVGVFFDEKTRCSLFVAAMLDNTRRGGAGRAVVDKKVTRGRGAGGSRCEKSERGFLLPSPSPLSRFLRSPLQSTLWHSALNFAMFVLTCIPPNDPISACGATSFPGYHSFPKWTIRDSTQTAVINMTIKRMLENKII